MFDVRAAERWRPTAPLITALLALCLFTAVLANTLATLRGPHLLDYQVAPSSQPRWWRVTWVWPSSAAWDGGLRVGTLLYGRTPPATQGITTVRVWSAHGLRAVRLPPRGDVDPPLAAVELGLAVVLMAIGAVTVLLARERAPARLLLLFCLVLGISLCAVAGYTHAGAIGDSLLFEVCFFALLPAVTLALATMLPPGGRTRPLPWWAPATLASVVLALIVAGLVIRPLYTPSRDLEGLLFALALLGAVALWVWRARPERGGPRWPEYRLVLLGLGGGFGGFALLAILPTMVPVTLPWPPEASGLVLLLIPLSLSYALLRHRLLALRHPLRRTVLTLLLLGVALSAGATISARGSRALGLVVAVALAGIGLPLAQRALDRLFPDTLATYAALIARAGDQLSLAADVSELAPVLAMMCQGLDLAGLRLRRGDAVLAEAGVVDPAYALRLPVVHEGAALATLAVGEKRHHDGLLGADREALAVFSQQVGAFLARHALLLRLRETVAHLEETQGRLLTARRLERERLGQDLHRGPLQDAVLLAQLLATHDAPASPALSVLAPVAQGMAEAVQPPEPSPLEPVLAASPRSLAATSPPPETLASPHESIAASQQPEPASPSQRIAAPAHQSAATSPWTDLAASQQPDDDAWSDAMRQREAARMAAALARSLRAILTETGSSVLADLGLPAALRAYAAYLAPYAREHHCAIALHTDDSVSALAEDAAFALYQLAHEALSNAVRHSGARAIQLTLRRDGDVAVLEVRDDGRGLPPGWERARIDHRGLSDALDLVASVSGGTASAGDAPGGGTLVSARAPLYPVASSTDGEGKESAMPQHETIRILIAEDHAVVRQGLRRLLLEDERLRVVGEARTGHEILSLVVRQQPDLLLLDLDLPGLGGLEAVRALRDYAPRLPRILILSAFHEEEYVRRARELGVAGFLSKESDGAQVREAIYRVMAGGTALDPEIAGIVQEQSYSPAGRLRRYADGSHPLSTAELAVLRGMMGEQPYEEIARALGRKPGTVRSQAAKVCEKLGVNSRQQAVLKALQLGIITLEDQ